MAPGGTFPTIRHRLSLEKSLKKVPETLDLSRRVAYNMSVARHWAQDDKMKNHQPGITDPQTPDTDVAIQTPTNPAALKMAHDYLETIERAAARLRRVADNFRADHVMLDIGWKEIAELSMARDISIRVIESLSTHVGVSR